MPMLAYGCLCLPLAYARLSSKSQEQNSSEQNSSLESHDINPRIYERRSSSKKHSDKFSIEVGSAANNISERPIFSNLIDHELKENDLLLVTKIDRCSRNTLEFLKLQDILFKRKITFVAEKNILDLPTSVDLATNKLIATTLSGIAEFPASPNSKIIDAKNDRNVSTN